MATTNVTVEGGMAFLPDGSVVNLLQIQATLNAAFQEHGDMDFGHAAEELSRITQKWQGPHGDFLDGSYFDVAGEETSEGGAAQKQEVVQVFQGYFGFEGNQLDVEFQAPVGSTVAEKDAAFMAALAQKADIDYLAVGESVQPVMADNLSPDGQETDAGTDVKYFIGKLHERNGEYEYVHTLRFMTNGNPGKYLDDIASRFYDEDGGDEEDGSYSFNLGCIIVTPGICREITKDFYVQCYELGAITGV